MRGSITVSPRSCARQRILDRGQDLVICERERLEVERVQVSEGDPATPASLASTVLTKPQSPREGPRADGSLTVWVGLGRRIVRLNVERAAILGGAGEPAFWSALSRGEAVSRLRAAFAEAGIETPGMDARILVAAALGIDAARLVTSRGEPVGAGGERLADFAARRLAREPVARILGSREFWGLPFLLSAGTLEPRPDTETVVEAALARAPDRAAALSILDLGTGSGCILIALLGELGGATGLGIDRSLDALSTARRNADANGAGSRALFAVSDWAEAVTGPVDLVVANPPYIPGPDIARLDPEVARHDPRAALDGGSDGLSAYRSILADLPRLLAPGASAVLEVGHDQAVSVASLGRDHGLTLDAVLRDLGGRDRVVVLSRAGRTRATERRVLASYAQRKKPLVALGRNG